MIRPRKFEPRFLFWPRKFEPRFRFWGAAAVVLVVMAGCGGHLSSVDRLDQTLSYFHTHLLQAGEVQRAAAYVDRDMMESFLSMHDPELNAYTLVDFTILSVRYHKNAEGTNDAATVVVKASVIRDKSITVERRQFLEKWELRGARWTLVSERMLDSNEMGASGELGDDVDYGAEGDGDGSVDVDGRNDGNIPEN